MRLLPDNPGGDIRGDSFDAIDALTSVLDIDHDQDLGSVTLTESGLVLLPRLLDVVQLDSGVRTCTTLEIRHPLFGPGVFEFQHAAGTELMSAMTQGFDQWRRSDLLALLQAVSGGEGQCTHLRLEMPATEDHPARVRIAVLGPVVRYAAPTAAKADDDQHDPHCPCCLLAKNFEAFQALLQGTEPFGVRLLSMRNDDNSVAADCRVNGNDFPAGMEALRAYAEGWPGEGMDMRKQYVVMYTGTDP